MIRALLPRPGLWPEAIRTALAMAPAGWWRRPPFLPIPDRSHLEWRTATAYGSADAPVVAEDVIDFLEWRRRERRSR